MLWIAECEKDIGRIVLEKRLCSAADESCTNVGRPLATHGDEGEVKLRDNFNKYYNDPNGVVGRFDFALAA